MPTPMSTLVAGVVALCCSAVPAHAGTTTRVTCAASPGGARAWISAREGLVLVDWPLARGAGPQAERVTLRLGRGAFPRFLGDGRFVFETSTDDGHHVLATRAWVLDPGATAPRAPRAGEDLGAFVPPAGGAPDDGGPLRVCVDPGHGGGDPGAQGNGLQEKDVTLAVGLALADWLADDTADPAGGAEWDVLVTRETDVFVSLAERVTMAGAFDAQAFLSIHANAFVTPDANGTETYAASERSGGAPLRDLVHERMLEAWGLTDRGTKTASFYVLVNTTMPAELSEMGFVTNPGDALLLGDPQARDEMALAHLLAVQEFLGVVPYEPDGAPGVAGTLQGILYDASVGTSAPLAGATVSLADGTFTTTSGSGYFAFELPAGRHAFAATAPGFAIDGASETVTGGDVWESLGLWPQPGPTLAVAADGALVTLDVAGEPNAPLLLLAALAPGVPPPAPLAAGTLWPGPETLAVVPLGTLDAGGELHLEASVVTGLGAPVHLQVFTGGAGSALSNGAALVAP